MINGVILILILLIFRSLMATSLGLPLMVYIYLNLFALPVTDFNNRNKLLISNLLKQGYRYHKSKRKAMNRNWGNQKANPALNTKAGNK